MLNSVEADSAYSLVDLKLLSGQVSVVRYDYCDQSVDGDYTWPALMDELVLVTDSLKTDQAIFGGLSMGAGTILHLAVSFPERIKGMILVTPAPGWEMREKTIMVYRKIESQTSQHKIPEILKRIVNWSQDPPEFYEQQFPGTKKKLQDLRLKFAPGYYTKIYSGGAESDYPSREQISEITVPTLIISVPGDVNHPSEMANELKYLIKNSDLFEVTSFDDYLKLQNKVFDFIRELD
jgi:pimeloyl-ACP methyl ester carboxylesterase